MAATATVSAVKEAGDKKLAKQPNIPAPEPSNAPANPRSARVATPVNRPKVRSTATLYVVQDIDPKQVSSPLRMSITPGGFETQTVSNEEARRLPDEIKI